MIYLSIYPNSRGFGYCVVEAPCIFYDYGVCTIRPMSNTKSLNRIKKLIKRFNPDVIIIQELKGKNSHKTKRVKELHNLIRNYAKEKSIKVLSYTREQIRFVFSEHGAKSKYEIAELITNWFKEDLQDYMPYYRKPWMCEDHMMGMYDAISLFLVSWYLGG